MGEIIIVGVVVGGICLVFAFVALYFYITVVAITPRVEYFLFARLLEIAEDQGLKVSFHKNLNDAAGAYLPLKREILLRKGMSGFPWVLAHEIGHYIAWIQYQDRSEEAADREGRKTVESLLPWWRRYFGKWVLDIFFGEKPKV